MRLVKVKDISDLQNGKAFKPSDWTNDGLPIIRIQNLNDESKPFNHCDGEVEEKYHIKNGDLLFSWSGTPGTSFGAFIWNRGEAYLNQHIYRVDINNETDTKFFKYALNSKLREIIDQSHGGVGLKHITKKKLENIEIPLPSLSEQKAIVAKLDRAQRLIYIDREMLAKYDELIQSVFLEMFGDPVTNPKGWEKVKLKELTMINSGSTPSRKKPEYFGGKIPWVKTTEVSGRYIYESEETITELGLKESSCKLYPKDTILVAMYGQGKTRGNVGMLKLEATTNQACAGIYPSEKFKPDFLFNYLKLQYEELREMGRGGNQPNLNVGMIKDYEIILPPIEMQEKFLNISESIMKERAENKSISKKSEELFSSLVQNFFN